MKGNMLSGMSGVPLYWHCLGAGLRQECCEADADAAVRLPKPRLSIAAAVLFVLLVACCVPLVSADIIIEPEAQIGELVHIRIVPALEHQELVIITPNSTYRFIGGIPESAAFMPEIQGLHIIRIIDNNALVDTASFTVTGDHDAVESTEQEFTVTQQVKVGQPIIITAPVKDVQAVGVKTADDEFQYMDDIRPITFIPEAAGVIDVWLRYANGTRVTQQTEVLGSDPLQQPQQPAQAEQPSVVVQQNTSVRQAPAEVLEELAPGIYNLELRDVSRSLRSVRFRELKHNTSQIRVEEVIPSHIKGNRPDRIIDAFAIDPSGLEFGAASFTFTAVGNELYKCVEYDYESQECYGQNVKIMDLVPGQSYTLELTPEDPLFSQTGYLANPSFDSSTSSWTQLTGAGNPTYAWTASDSGQSGIADITLSGSNRNGVGNYYQAFTLTAPSGTTLAGINFSALWRISTYSRPGSVDLMIQDSTRTTTYCTTNAAFSGSTVWQSIRADTGSGGCSLASFSPGGTYTFLLRCTLATGPGGGSTETCRWDDASVVAWYNDTAAPSITNVTDSPDPVSFGDALSITANVSDNIAVDTVRVEIAGTNYTMSGGAGYSFSGFDTAQAPGAYTYRIYANDTNGNTASSADNTFTIQDVTPPVITILGPANDTFTSLASFVAQYNVSDQVGLSSCAVNASGASNSTSSPPLGTTLELAAALPVEGVHLWNITCTDTSSNQATSETYAIVRDSTAPTVSLGLSDNAVTGNTTVYLDYTPSDTYLANCSLWGNFTGTWSLNRSNTSVTNGTGSVFPQSLGHGTYLWNVQCTDLAGNAAFSANRTVVVDRIAPAHSAASISPASGVTYAAGASYSFNITWNDAMTNISAVYLETNFTGTLANVTPSQSGNVYQYTFADRPAGSYAYRWHGIDAVGNVNATPQSTYLISKAASSLNLTLNGSYANMSVQLNEHVNSTGWITTPMSGYLELYRDGILINNGQGRLENITQLTVEKRYNFTLLYNATQNYSEGRAELSADVVDLTAPTVELGNPANNSIQNSDVTFFFTPQDNIEIGNCTILLDGFLNQTKDVARNELANITVPGIADGMRNWTVSCTDTSNNTGSNSSYKYFTVDTDPPAAFSLSAPSGNVSNNLTPLFIWSQTSDLTFSHYLVQVDNDAGFGSVNYQANTSPATNTSRQFTLLDQAIWYWRVTAYDLAGNSRASSETFNYTTDASAPSVVLAAPTNGSHYSLSQIALNYSVTDFTQITNCSLFINSTLNQTDMTITQGMNSFTVPVDEQAYSWQITCRDAAANPGSSATRTFTIDRTPPVSFIITGPADSTISSDSTPTYTFTQTNDPHFANYTIEVSDNESFPYANHTLSTGSITNTSVIQNPALADGIWYWRVTAYDLAGNNMTIHPTYIVDTNPPAAFDLIAPAGTEMRNDTPLFQWQQSSDVNFANYTLIISDDAAFASTNYSNSTSPAGNTSTIMALAQDILFYWRVIAYDLAGNSRNSTSTFTYLADFTAPVVQQLSPLDAATVTTSPLVPFRFNISDPGTIVNCSLYINSTLEKTLNNPSKDTAQAISHNLDNGAYSWHISCTDAANNIGNTTTRTLTLDVQTPVQRFYESSPGASTFTPPALINLSTNDGSESSASITASGGILTTMANATHTANGQGMLVSDGAAINFSGVFDTSRAGEFYITWKAHKVNASGPTLLCQAGNDNTGGTPIAVTAKSTYAGACTASAGGVRLLAGDNLTLTVNLYKSGGSSRTATHYWEGTSDSYLQFQGYNLGTLLVNFTNLTDPALSEDASYVEQCNVTCSNGACLSTEVSLQHWDGVQWTAVGASGNITLNGSQFNPLAFGNINGTNITDISLYGALHSYNNTLRCFATSTYSNATSSLKNISVIDRLAPNVTLGAPAPGAAFEPQNITFLYAPSDRRLASCSLWGNWSGSWAVNQTHTSPANGSENSFIPVYLDYGLYSWNVYCDDTVGNTGYSENRTLHVAGDVSIEDGAISFSTASPVEGQEITISANVTNNANRTEPSVLVRFYAGDPDDGGIQIGTDGTISLAPLSSSMANTSWAVPIGTTDIYITVDGDGSIIESDEGNNKAFASLQITMWQTYYGNVTGNVTLGAGGNDSFANWQFINQSGNIFISDSDTTNGISFSFLQALGRNTSGVQNSNTLDDFGELDVSLNTSGFNDNVNSTYTAAGVPIAAESFTIFGAAVPQVPVAASSANFTTGILWDTDDSGNSHYDSTDGEDVVFVTRILNMTQSPNGLVDYEIWTPSRLKNYKGSSATVDFYYEIQ